MVGQGPTLLEWWARGPPYLLPVIDMLMGTFKRPPANLWPEEYGVMTLETVPIGIVAQTLMPMGKKKTYTEFVGKPE